MAIGAYEKRRARGWPYWKVQYYNDLTCAWVDIQESHSDPVLAVAAKMDCAARTGQRTRLMRVDRGGRRVDDI